MTKEAEYFQISEVKGEKILQLQGAWTIHNAARIQSDLETQHGGKIRCR